MDERDPNAVGVGRVTQGASTEGEEALGPRTLTFPAGRKGMRCCGRSGKAQGEVAVCKPRPRECFQGGGGQQRSVLPRERLIRGTPTSSSYRGGIVGKFRGQIRESDGVWGSKHEQRQQMEGGKSWLDVAVDAPGGPSSPGVAGLIADRSRLSRSLGHALG